MEKLKNKTLVYVKEQTEEFGEFYGEITGISVSEQLIVGLQYIVKILDRNNCKALQTWEYNCVVIFANQLEVIESIEKHKSELSKQS